MFDADAVPPSGIILDSSRCELSRPRPPECISPPRAAVIGHARALLGRESRAGVRDSREPHAGVNAGVNAGVRRCHSSGSAISEFSLESTLESDWTRLQRGDKSL